MCSVNLVMKELENAVIANLYYVPHFYKRYVYNCILWIPSDKLEYTYHVFTSFHPHFQFTIEQQKTTPLTFWILKKNMIKMMELKRIGLEKKYGNNVVWTSTEIHN